MALNVQEARLQREIDPFLTDRALSRLVGAALEGAGADSSRARAAVSGYRVLIGGCWNRVVGVQSGDREVVCKISPRTDDERIAREFEVLRVFAEQTDLPVPQPLLLDRGEIVPGTTLVMSLIPGAVMHECFGLLNFGARRHIIDRIADDLAELHTIRSRGFGGVEVDPDARADRWADFWLPRFDAVIDEAAASGSVPAALIEGARALRPHVRPLLDIGTESTMTHYDVWSGNVMIDVERTPPRVSGYIDIPGYFADRARELSFAMLFGIANRRFFETYLQRHSLDPGFEVRANLYNLKMNIKHVQMYPGQQVYQEGGAENLRFLQRAL